jgi:hypothetical protein
MSRQDVVDILCKRDGCTADHADELIQQALDEMEACGYDDEACEDIMMSVLGLEMDYILDLL